MIEGGVIDSVGMVAVTSNDPVRVRRKIPIAYQNWMDYHCAMIS